MNPIEKIGRAADDVSYAVISLTESVIDCREEKVTERYVSECRMVLRNKLIEYAAVLQEISP